MPQHHHQFELDIFHEHGRGGFDIWHIVGIVLGIILLLAIIGFVINCFRNRGFGFGGQTYGTGYGAGQQVYY